MRKELEIRGKNESEIKLEMALAAQYYHSVRTNFRTFGTKSYGHLGEDGQLTRDSWAFWFNGELIDISDFSLAQIELRRRCLLQGNAFIYTKTPNDDEENAEYRGRGRNESKNNQKSN